MRSLNKVIGGISAGGGLGYGLSDGLEPLIPFLFVLSAMICLVAGLVLQLEREVARD